MKEYINGVIVLWICRDYVIFVALFWYLKNGYQNER